MVVTTVRAVGVGDGAAAGDGLGVTALGAGGVLAYVSQASMMKRRVGAGAVFLGASGRDVSKSVAVGTLSVRVSLRRFLDLKSLREEEEGWEEDGNLSGLTETTTEVACLVSLAAQSLLRYLAAPILTSFGLWIDYLMKSKSCSSSSGRMWVGIE